MNKIAVPAKVDTVGQVDLVEKYHSIKAGLLEGESIRFVDEPEET